MYSMAHFRACFLCISYFFCFSFVPRTSRADEAANQTADREDDRAADDDAKNNHGFASLDD